MPTAVVDGVELYYETAGAGPRLVLTHGAWTDGTGWAPAVRLLAGRFEVVTWDRRGHTRSQDGDGPGSRDEDAADLAALIERLGGGPVHLAGNSYGGIVVLSLAAARPDLVASAAAHEPPLLGLLAGTADPALAETLARVDREVGEVLALIEAGEHRAAAARFLDRVAVGSHAWARLPGYLRTSLARNAPTFLDEERDPTSRTLDVAALAAAGVPLLLTRGTEGPGWYTAAIAELTRWVPGARVEVIPGAGHTPHATHPEQWVDTLLRFQESVAAAREPDAG